MGFGLLPKASRASRSDRSERGGCDVKNVDPARKIDAGRAARVASVCNFRSLRCDSTRVSLMLTMRCNGDDDVMAVVLRELKAVAEGRG